MEVYVISIGVAFIIGYMLKDFIETCRNIIAANKREKEEDQKTEK